MSVKSQNPYTLETNFEAPHISHAEIVQKIEEAHKAFQIWKNKTIAERSDIMRNLARLMVADVDNLARLDAIEMGMPIKDALWDVKKSASNIDFFCDNAASLIADKEVNDGKMNAVITYEPLGVIFSVMPWNYPFNQVLRSVIPNLLAGNVVLMKHASNVPLVALKLEELFLQAGLPQGVYTNLFLPHDATEFIISHPFVIWANVTGSVSVGREIGKLSGQYLKPSVLELGWSDPFIVLDHSDMDFVASEAVKARFSNAGQKCNSAKRFIVLEHLHDVFVQKYTEKVAALKVWDPLDPSTDIWPLAKKWAQNDMANFVSDAVGKWAKIALGGKIGKQGYIFEPTILTDVTKDMIVWSEEVFGPIAPIMKAKNIEEAVALANDTEYGLGCSIYGDDMELLKKTAARIEASNIALNKVVTSYAFLPYGWIKKSGYGKELAEHGLKVFMNEKVIVM